MVGRNMYTCFLSTAHESIYLMIMFNVILYGNDQTNIDQ